MFMIVIVGSPHLWASETNQVNETIKINFQGPMAPTPTGFYRDIGKVYGLQKDDLIYGWDKDLTKSSRVRKGARSKSIAHNTLVFMLKRKWEMRLPNGPYKVSVALGDPNSKSLQMKINVEGKSFSTKTTSKNRFSEKSFIVAVKDNRLTIKDLTNGTHKARINFVKITSLRKNKSRVPSSASDEIKINFLPKRAINYSGYLRDSGEAFGPKSKGLIYGWSHDMEKFYRDRNHKLSKDQRYDTFAFMIKRKWEIQLPNGKYSFRMVTGDPNKPGTLVHLNVEGKPVKGRTSQSRRWIDKEFDVTVRDGRLTLVDLNPKNSGLINFLVIKSKGTDSIVPAPRPGQNPEPKPRPKPEPKPQPKPEPKPEPKPQPKPEPKPQPKPEPKPQPKPEPKPKNHAPNAKIDSATTQMDRSVTIFVLKNDSDKDGDRLEIEAVNDQTTRGQVTINRNNTITYFPPSGFSGTDSFIYKVSDGRLEDSAKVTIDVLRPIVSTGKVKVIAPSAHPNLYFNNAEIASIRSKLFSSSNSPEVRAAKAAWAKIKNVKPVGKPGGMKSQMYWHDSYLLLQGRSKTNMEAAMSYMIEPTSAKEAALKKALLSLTRQDDGSKNYLGRGTQAAGHMQYPLAFMYDLLYNTGALSEEEKKVIDAYFSKAAKNLIKPHGVDTVVNEEGSSRYGYDNFYTLAYTGGLVLAMVSHDQSAVDEAFVTTVPDNNYKLGGRLSKTNNRSFKNLIEGGFFQVALVTTDINGNLVLIRRGGLMVKTEAMDNITTSSPSWDILQLPRPSPTMVSMLGLIKTIDC